MLGGAGGEGQFSVKRAISLLISGQWDRSSRKLLG
jgi:hypothetical protein